LVRAKFGVLRREDGAPADVAAELGVGLPLGGGGALARDGGFSLAPRVMASRQIGLVLASAELGVRLRSTVNLAGDSVGSHLDAGASLATQASQLLRLELILRTESSFTSTPGSAELLAGARYQLPRSIELFALTGPGLRSGPGTPAFRLVVGIALSRAAPTPPRAPAPPPMVASVTPPPPPPAVIIDPCAPGQQHEPAQCPDLDDDGDGIPNKADRCPTEKGLPELQGCPAKDADGDGVPDHLDNCPLVPGPAENQGCPLVQKQLVVITRRRLELKQRIFFDTGLATIQRRSFALLDQVADVLRAHPDLPPLSIGGHTDNKGKPEVNRKLSQTRAESVRAYLVKKGVAAGGITARGFGSDQPLDSNLSPAGRANNRRVEFTLTTEETVSETHAVEAPGQRNEVSP
jgi:outer membrane protein OmpA-like peptidoglycan-associated protein